MTPLLKNVLLAFAAGALTAVSVSLQAGMPANRAAVASIIGGALYAGIRAAVGTAKEAVSGVPFKVDTEDPAAE
jgi:hypothetical protein